MKFNRSIVLGAGSGLLLGWFTGCGLGLTWTHGNKGERYQAAKELSRVKSPNGMLEAVISYRDAGALSGDYAHLSIVRSGTSTSQAAKAPALLVVYGGVIHATWKDDHHLLADPGKGDVNFLESQWELNDKDGPVSEGGDPLDAEVQLVYGTETLYDSHGRFH